MNYERYDIVSSKEALFDKGCFSLGMGCALTLYSVVPFAMKYNLESLVTQGSVNPVNSFLTEMVQEYLVNGAYVVSGGLALICLGVSFLSRSHRIQIPPVKEEIYE